MRQLRVGIADLEAKLKLQQQLLSDIKSEQSRIRSNMSALYREADLYSRYVKKLTTQEDNFDKALRAIAETRVKTARMRRELDKFPLSAENEADQNDPFGDADPFGAANPFDSDDPFGDDDPFDN